MAQPIAKPFHDPGHTITCHASADIAAGRFVTISGARQAGDGLGDLEYTVSQASDPTKPIIGTSLEAAKAGQKIAVQRVGVVAVEAGAAITAGAYVTTDANGRAAVGTQANAAGVAYDDAAAPDGSTFAEFAVGL